jgi:hypothetical protein
MNVVKAVELIRQEEGLTIAEPQQHKSGKKDVKCPCKEWGRNTGGRIVCMFPERKDGSCPKSDGFRRRTEAVWY